MVVTFAKIERHARGANSYTLHRVLCTEYMDPDWAESQPEEGTDEESGTKDRSESEETQKGRQVPGKIDLRDLPQGAPLHGKTRIQP